ncbi:MAG: HAMP domain-containing protein [Anaerolineae bacterium]|nr:HAMP domain-containing protein [Anaerolineae bacterium]
MSIRLRLTLLYSSILAVTLTAFSIVVYLALAYSTQDIMQDTLALEMQRLLETDVQSPGFVKWPDDSLGKSETYWQACDNEGHVVGRTDNLQDHHLPLSGKGLEQVRSGQPVYESTVINNAPLMIYSYPIIQNESVEGYLQVARSTAEQEQALHLLQTSLIGGSIITMMIAVGIGWVIAGAALKPVNQLTRTAQIIKEERNFERRVQHHGPPDEIGQLAVTFNAMLASLQEAYQQVAQALQSQRWFVADASHELRTPLTIMRGNLVLLQRESGIPEEERKAILTDIVEENERMIRLVNDLLTLARTDRSETIEVNDIRLSPLFAEIERQVTGICEDCTFMVSTPPNATAVAERDLLKQVLLILLDNAFKFTPAQGTIKLSAEQQAAHTLIRVQDSGIGIAQQDLPRIFQRFYRSDQARNGSGYGLGLPIAKALIEKQGGQLIVESSTGQGSVFTIILPTASDTIRPESSISTLQFA